MARRKSKVVEIVCRVRVPAMCKASDVRREVANNWYGKIFTADDGRTPATIRPRWGRATTMKEG